MNPFKFDASDRSTPGLRGLNIVFVIFAILIIGANAFLVNEIVLQKKTFVQSLSGVANASLEVVDAVWQPTIKSTKTDKKDYSGFLVMGIDSRKLVFDGKEFKGKDRDIDSIMQVVVDHKTGNVFIFSIPRDTGVTITETCARQDRQYFKSVNHAYKLGEDGDCPNGGGVNLMMKYVTSITGFDNHYFAIISYDAFRDIINTVGDEVNGLKGLYIDVPRNIQDYYPREVGSGFEAVYFKKGRQFIDSVKLLKYARVRKSSSDFERAARQQQVMVALQEKIFAGELLSNPQKLFQLYQTFQKNALFSQLTLDDIRGGIDMAKQIAPKLKDGQIYKLVLDDKFGGLNKYLTKPFFSNGKHNRYGYYLSPVAYKDAECVEQKDEYCKVKEYLDEIYAAPDSYLDKGVLNSAETKKK